MKALNLYSYALPTPTIHAGWFRLGAFGPGVSWTRMAPLFSERYGYRRALFTVRGWRVFYLPRFLLQPYTGSRRALSVQRSNDSTEKS